MRQQREAGQTMVFTILFLGVLLAFGALLIDGGSWMWSKRSLQGDADAAALAAARELPTSPGSAPSVAEQYVETHNSGDEAELESFVSDPARMTAHVTVRRTAGSSPFGKLLGFDDTNIRARATARIAQVSSVDGVLPFAALDGQLDPQSPGVSEAITVAPGGISTGHIGAVAPAYSPPACTDGDANSASEVTDAIESWFAGGITTCGTEVGNQIDTSTGARPVPIRNGFDSRLGPDGIHPDRFADVFSWDADTQRYVLEKPESPRIGFIPIISTGSATADWGDIPGTSTPVEVVDYVMVYIGRVGTPGEPAYLRGGACVPDPCPGTTIQVWLTPIFGMMAPNFDYSLSDTWNPNSLAPTAITLED